MTNYQKAIKVKKICESLKECTGEKECPYLKYCKNSEYLFFSPQFQDLPALARAIQIEKWIVK